MTTADSASAALVARGYAALHQIRRIAVELIEDLEVPAIIDRETNTVYIQLGLPLDEAMFLMQSGIEALCRGRTVVERDDGGTGWAGGEIAVGAEYEVPTLPEQPRPFLRLV
ncbi:hypothetical protein Lesp02_70210 [Lentzea sp. NBRC 105346]|uniref:hypothetical protein n=1 Tax=Lentzea sp. NBRC 105346 TaxID=3032205 RepID=UPI0024A11D88|nr:hypothetical protein [Lentzea sp. NBRC 105346]GLZ34834.1 hypothetical protein Lesp02_70210 [Lentzea sp. NBRC 105346]